MKNKGRKVIKKITTWSFIILLTWAVTLGYDYWRTVCSFEKPLFAKIDIGYDDGGSGTYKGIGYSINIEGNFMPEDEILGVTHAEFFIFGKEINSVVRD